MWTAWDYREEVETTPSLSSVGRLYRQIFVTRVSERAKKGVTSPPSPIQHVHFIHYVAKKGRKKSYIEPIRLAEHHQCLQASFPGHSTNPANPQPLGATRRPRRSRTGLAAQCCEACARPEAGRTQPPSGARCGWSRDTEGSAASCASAALHPLTPGGHGQLHSSSSTGHRLTPVPPAGFDPAHPSGACWSFKIKKTFLTHL